MPLKTCVCIEVPAACFGEPLGVVCVGLTGGVWSREEGCDTQKNCQVPIHDAGLKKQHNTHHHTNEVELPATLFELPAIIVVIQNVIIVQKYF